MNRKTFVPVPSTKGFLDRLTTVDRGECQVVIDMLQVDGRLSAPFAEKVEAGMFAMRIIKADNIRIFYIYGKDDAIYGVHAYFKRTERIPPHELRMARRVSAKLKTGGLA